MTDTRKAEIRNERRRRDFSGARPKRLHVSESLLDRENFEYRWVNDPANPEDPLSGRVEMRESQDWDKVEVHNRDVGKTPTKSSGASISAHAGTAPSGAAMRAVLMRKPKKYAEDDRAKKQAMIDKREKAMNEGANHDQTVETVGRRAA